jgi:hypothetical protein
MKAKDEASKKPRRKAPTVKFRLARLGLVTIVVMNMAAIVHGTDAVSAEFLDSCCGVQADGEAELLFDRGTRLEILESHKGDILLACLAA